MEYFFRSSFSKPTFAHGFGDTKKIVLLAKKSMPFDNKQRLKKEYSWHNYYFCFLSIMQWWIIDNFINNIEGSNQGRTAVSHSPKSGQNLRAILRKLKFLSNLSQFWSKLTKNGKITEQKLSFFKLLQHQVFPTVPI